MQSIRYITFALCVFAAATDMLDGYLARKLNQVTEVGKIIDPLADKAAMAVIVVKLFLIGEISYFLFLYNNITGSFYFYWWNICL